MSSAIRISILANAAQAKSELTGVAGAAENVGNKFSKFRLPAALAIGALAAVGKASVKSASDAEQSIGATETVFGKYADTVVKSSKKAATEYGLSANNYRENANLIGSLFKNQGVELKDLGSETEKMIGKAADLSATFGGDAATAVEALSSAFKGEFDPLEKYGISLKASTVTAAASALAQKKYGKSLDDLSTQQQGALKRQATTNIINKQSADSTGAFARETDTLAHKQQVAAAQIENLKVKLGTYLLPAVAAVTDTVIAFVSVLEQHSTATLAAAGAVGALATLVIAASAATKIYTAGVVIYTAVTTTITAATIVWKNAQLALNIAMILCPVGVVVVAIVALVAVFVLAYTKSEKFRSVIDKSWTEIKAATKTVFEWVGQKIKKVFDAIELAFLNFTGPGIIIKHWDTIRDKTSAAYERVKEIISEKMSTAREAVTSTASGIRERITGAWASARDNTRDAWQRIVEIIAEKIGAFMDRVRGIKDKVTGALDGAGEYLYTAGQAIIKGLISGIESMTEKVKDKLKSLTDLIPKVKGPPQRDAKLLTPAGRSIIQSLIAGFEAEYPAVKKSLTSLTRDVSGFDASLSGEVKVSARSAFDAASASRRDRLRLDVRFTAQQLDALTRGRSIRADLDAFDRAGGRVLA